MKQEKIKILKYEVGKEPYAKEINNDLKTLQTEVSGLIQLVNLSDTCCVVVNEEGKLNGSKPNRWLGESDIICGDFFVCGDDGENFGSITDEDIEFSKKFFGEALEFAGDEKELEPECYIGGFEFK